MTVPRQRRILRYVGNGTTTNFAIPFTFLRAEAIEITFSDAFGRLAGGSPGYSIVGGASGSGLPATGSVVLTAPLPTGMTLRIRGRQAIDQETSYAQTDRFPAKSHERALDKGTIIDQELRDDAEDAATRIARLEASMQRIVFDPGVDPLDVEVFFDPGVDPALTPLRYDPGEY